MVLASEMDTPIGLLGWISILIISPIAISTPVLVTRAIASVQPLSGIDWPVHWLRSYFPMMAILFQALVAVLTRIILAFKATPRSSVMSRTALVLVTVNVAMVVCTSFAVHEWYVGPGIPKETLATTYNSAYCRAYAYQVCAKEDSADAAVELLGMSDHVHRPEGWLPMVGVEQGSAAACWTQVNDTAVALWRTCRRAAPVKRMSFTLDPVVNKTPAVKQWCRTFLAETWGILSSDKTIKGKATVSNNASPYIFDQRKIAAYFNHWWFDVFFYSIFTLITVICTTGVAYLALHESTANQALGGYSSAMVGEKKRALGARREVPLGA